MLLSHTVVLDIVSVALRHGSTPRALALYGVTDIRAENKVGRFWFNR